MANVKFLRGQSNGLPSGNDIIDGALYVTLDSKRLFMGYDNGTSKSLLPLAEGITTVTNVSSLTSIPAAQHTGEFYYVTEGNILAYSDGTTWRQTNPDTHLVSGQTPLAVGDVSSNTSVITLGLKETDDPQNNAVQGSFGIKGGTNVTITKDGSNVVISSKDDDTTYEIKTAAGTQITEGSGANQKTRDVVDIILDSTKANDDSTIKIKDSDSVDVNIDANGVISFAVNTSGVGSVTSNTLGAGRVDTDTGDPIPSSVSGYNYGFHSVVTSTTDTFGANVDPQISVKNASKTSLSPIHFESGVAALDVYSTGAVDTLIADLARTIDAMHYMGSVQTLSALKAQPLHNGDVYIATGTIDFTNETRETGSEIIAEPGYLIIVTGTENTANNDPVNGTPAGQIPVANASYLIVKSEDTDTTYQVSTTSHGITVDERAPGENPEAIGGITLANSSDITLSDSVSGHVNTVTIGHASLRTTNAQGANDSNKPWIKAGTADSQTAGSSKTFNVVTAVDVNAQGHVVEYTVTPITVVDTHIDTGVSGNSNGWTTTAGAPSTSNGVTTVTVTQTSVGDLGSMDFSLASSTLSLSSSGSTVTADLVWGTFGS